MRVQPKSLDPALVLPTPSQDFTPPKCTILSPSSSSTLTLPLGSFYATISAEDVGGYVASVEVRFDGDPDQRWHPAERLDAEGKLWRYLVTVPDTFTSPSNHFVLMCRAVDDSLNMPKQATVHGVKISSSTKKSTQSHASDL